MLHLNKVLQPHWNFFHKFKLFFITFLLCLKRGDHNNFLLVSRETSWCTILLSLFTLTLYQLSFLLLLVTCDHFLLRSWTCSSTKLILFSISKTVLVRVSTFLLTLLSWTKISLLSATFMFSFSSPLIFSSLSSSLSFISDSLKSELTVPIFSKIKN